MLQFTGQDMLSFIKGLLNGEACKAYLAKIKWQNGFTCSKCSHTKGCEKSRCNYYSCYYTESSAASTLFHKAKFGLQKHFYSL